MARKCQPGMICIENITMIFIIFLIGLVGYFIYLSMKNTWQITIKNPITIKQDPTLELRNNFLNRIPPIGNIFSNPFLPPLKNGVYHPKNSSDVRGIPINVPTQGHESSYQQVGILTRMNGVETILPLMGRTLLTNRSKFQYYTMSDKFNSIKLPISKGGRSCTNEYGCNELFNGDSVYVEGYQDAFKVTVYENNGPKYIPYI